MTTPTIAKINAAIAKHGIEIVKGNGYFWFDDLFARETYKDVPSVYTCHLRDLTLEQWVQHVEDAINNEGATS